MNSIRGIKFWRDVLCFTFVLLVFSSFSLVNAGSTLESTFTKNNPLYNSEKDRKYGEDWYKDDNVLAAYWFKLPSRIHKTPEGYDSVPFARILFFPKQTGNNQYKESNVAVGNIKKAVSTDWFTKGKAVLWGETDSYGEFYLKIDGKGKAYAIKKIKNNSPPGQGSGRQYDSTLVKVLKSILFLPIYGQFGDNPGHIYEVSIGFFWAHDSLTEPEYKNWVPLEVVKEKRRIAAVKKQYETEVAQAKSEQLQNDRLAREESQRAQIIDQYIAPGKQPVIWSSGPGSTSRYKSNDEFFYKLNKKYHEASRLSDKQQAFTAPKRGEFEKSDAYNVRVAKEKADHEKLMLKKSQALAAGRSQILEGLLNEELGNPTIASVNYNADQEKFTIGITSPTSFSIQVTLAHPISDAPRLKKEIQSAKPWVVFSFDSNETLQLVAVILQHNKTTLKALPANKVLVAMTDEKLKAHELKLDKEYAANKLRWKKEQKENDRLRAERRKTWPANTVGVMEAGTVACLSHKGANRALGIKRANNPYAAQAADCINIENKVYLSSIQHTQTGISRVLWHGARAEAFVSMDDIIQ